jgi:multisubunit Na+/H+ antiporter MnhG subunit
MITDYGNVIEFEPLQPEADISMIFMVIMGAVLISVPGVIFGLIFMNSTFYQRMYAEGKMRKVAGIPLAFAFALGACSWALDNRYNFGMSLENHILISFIILIIGLRIGYSSQQSNNKK